MNAHSWSDADAGSHRFACTFGHFTQKEWPDRRSLPWHDLVSILTAHAVGSKEGTCIVPAVFRGKRRHKADADRIDAAFLDSDTGASMDEIAVAVRRSGWAAIICSTHSHLTRNTKANLANWQKFCADRPIGAETAFLVETKGMLPHIAAGAAVLRQTDEFVFFEHNPCPKFRVVVPLLRPWLASGYSSQDAANAAWKDRIEALAAALELHHDQACTDTSRLFYLPRRPADGPAPEYTVIDGEPCDIFSLPSTEIPLVNGFHFGHRRQPAASFSDREYIDPDGLVFDLLVWARDCGDKFLITKALQARLPSLFTGRVADQVKVHIRCPNDDAHTEPGADGATFITDAGKANNKGFLVHCRHAHCDGKDRLFFLKRMLDRGWLSTEDLTSSEFMLPAKETDASNIKLNPNGQGGEHQAGTDKGANGGEDLDEAERQRILKQRKDTAKATVAAIIAEFNTKYMVVNEAGKAIIYAPHHDPILNRRYFDRISFEDLRRLYLNRMVMVTDEDGNPVAKPAAELWLRSRERRQFIGSVTFDPSGRANPADTLNLWQGFAVHPKPGDWTLLREHIRVIICREDPERFDYLIGWMARLVQHPAEQGEVAVIMRGGEGTGKGTLARALKHILGQHGLAISNAKHLTGNFNAHLRDCVFLFADECFFAGDKGHVGVLKSIITEPYLTIEGKYQNAIQTPNFLHLMMASNEEWVVPAALDARRFFVLEVGDEAKNNHEYFAEIWKQMESGGYEAMLYDLLHLDLARYNVRSVPITEGLQHQKKLSLPITESWWLDVLHRGYVFKSRLGLDEQFGRWHEEVATELLYASYSEYAERRRERHPLSRETLGRFMRGIGAKPKRLLNAVIGERMADIDNTFAGTSRKAALIRQPRPPGYHLGSLVASRADFVEATNLAVEWDEEDEKSAAA